jgi:pimeloyl-ACP methyl ester carboxylesterase
MLLCIHGLANSHASWAPLAERLTATHRVLALDLPGHGRSPLAGRPTSVHAHSLVLAAVMEALATPDITLVGHSMGAAVAAITAAQKPHAVRKLVLLAPPLPLDRFRSFNGDLLPQVIACLWPQLGIRALRRRVQRGGVDAYVERGLEFTCTSPETVAAMVPVLVQEINAAYEAGEDPLRCFLETARSLGLLVAGGRHYREALTRVQAPTQLIHGAQDRVLPPSSLDQIAELRPTWQVDVLPGVGHSPHMEAPAQVAQIVTALSRRGAAIARG